MNDGQPKRFEWRVWLLLAVCGVAVAVGIIFAVSELIVRVTEQGWFYLVGLALLGLLGCFCAWLESR